MHPELLLHMRAFTRLIYFVTEEEDRVLQEIKATMADKVAHVKVYNYAYGLIPLATLIDDWGFKKQEHPVDNSTLSINDALIAIYKEKTKNEKNFYILTDPDRIFKDEHLQRRVLNILHQVNNEDNTLKVLICLGSRRFIPEKLARYTEVIYDTGLTSDQILKVVVDTCKNLNLEPPEKPEELFKGLTTFEIKAALIQTFKKHKSYADPKPLAAYRLRQFKKTDLVQHVDVSEFTFDTVGGANRFKEWARRTKPAWTEEGRAFGLEPPKGVLTVGIWGTGKSLSVKALGSEWGLPVIQFDVGRMRSSALGESEANVNRAIKIIESMAPCVVWIDEAEKSLSGGQSSAFTDAGTTSRIIGAFSTWLQETKVPACVAMTANSIATLPVEFVNRMDERWFFDLPSREDRIDIMKIHLAKRGQNPARYDLAMLSEKAESLVGREIEQCIKSGMAESFVRKLPNLGEEVFAAELAHKPRIVRTMGDEIKATLDWIGYDPGIDDGIRARFAADPKGQDRRLKIA